MYYYLLGLLLVTQIGFCQDTLWIEAQELGIEGKGFADTESPFDRLPASAKRKVRKAVWDLSLHSAGLLVRFQTNAPQFFVRWELRNENLAMPHMPATGVSGVDVYALDRQQQYVFIGVGIPKSRQNLAVFKASSQSGHLFSYLLNFPLYNGLKSLKVGVLSDYWLKKDTLFKPSLSKPILFYGTSILQGGCASRAGMAYPSILGRRLGFRTINLGFSGNAKLEPEMQDLIAEVEAAIYVIDCHRNTTKEETQTQTEPAIRKIREKHPEAPIVVIEGSSPSRDFPTEEGKITEQIIKKLRKEGFKKLYYWEGTDLLGQDTEGTVDLVHPTDLGFQRHADRLTPLFKKILKQVR